ncbi:MAG: transglutaminase family protein [Bacteroidales bacterium]|nr:transglutaminase family protein [Bacteroidales bacterium]
MSDFKKNKEFYALINLLDEPDNNIFDQIQKKIITYGIDVLPLLKEVKDNTFNNLSRSRLKNIIHLIQYEDIINNLKKWKFSSSQNLLSAYILISKYEYPDINDDEIKVQINNITKDIWIESNDNYNAWQKIKILNYVLYDRYFFKGDKENFYSTDNLFINKVLENKKGNAVSLGLLYIIIAQILDLPVYGVNLPKHFILAYISKTEKDNAFHKNIMFYINPFYNGAIFTQKEINLFFKQINYKVDTSSYQAYSNVMLIKRLIHNLVLAYNRIGENDKAREIKHFLKALE